MKQEYPSLLELGFHPHTIEELKMLCVDAFPSSLNRPQIMKNLELIIKECRNRNIEGQIWIDGSFVTQKLEPEDSDILLHFSGEQIDSGTPEQVQLLNAIASNLKDQLMCDSYALAYYPPSHEWYNKTEWWKAYWIRQFGFSRSNQPKGIAVVEL